MKLEILKFCFVRYTWFIPVFGIIKSSSIYRRMRLYSNVGACAFIRGNRVLKLRALHYLRKKYLGEIGRG